MARGDGAGSADTEFSSGRSALRVASVAALGGLLFGYDSAVINGAVSALQEEFAISDYTLGIAVASALLGAAVGALTAGRLADALGRLWVMKLAAALFLISAVVTGIGTNIWLIVAFRVVGGVAVGIASVIAPAYIAETSPERIRGRLGSLQQLAIVTGIFVSLAVDWLLAEAAGGSNQELWFGMQAWRWMFLAEIIPALAYGLLAYTIPESPRYLVATHRIPEARRVLTRLLGEKNLEITINRIQDSLHAEKKRSWRDLSRPRPDDEIASGLINWIREYLWWLLAVFVVLAVAAFWFGLWPLAAVFLAILIGVAPAWFTILVLSRDLIVTLGYVTLYFWVQKRMEIHPSIMGKANTFLLLLTVTAILLSLYDPNLIPKSPLGVGSIRIAMLEFVILLTALTTVVSGLQYVYRGLVWLQDQVQTTTQPS